MLQKPNLIKKRHQTQSIRGPAYSVISTACAYGLAQTLKSEGFKAILLGNDPRTSSMPLCEAFIRGANSVGLKVYYAGIVPTPMLVKCATLMDISCALMITASHNPVSDNGFKLFSLDPLKPVSLEAIRYIGRMESQAIYEDVGRDMKSLYAQALASQFKGMHKQHCNIDTARGTWDHCLDLLSPYVEITTAHEPDPNKINVDAGILTRQSAKFSQLGMGVMVDGDGDRLMLVSQAGQLLDGDDILYNLFEAEPQSMVGTVMTNEALVRHIEAHSMQCERVKVGDRYVAESLELQGLRYGGEPCGHLIDMHWLSSSDPMYLMLALLNLPELKALPNKVSQRCFNISVEHDLQRIQHICQHYPLRYVIRASETEPVVRVLLEGSDDAIHACEQEIKALLFVL